MSATLDEHLPYRGIWFIPLYISGFVFSLMLLFAGELPEPIRRWTLPSLAVYVVGSGLITFLKELFHARHNAARAKTGQPPENLPLWKLWTFIGIYLLWIAAFIAYNVCRGAL